jgi:hypothetical protein
MTHPLLEPETLTTLAGTAITLLSLFGLAWRAGIRFGRIEGKVDYMKKNDLPHLQAGIDNVGKRLDTHLENKSKKVS